MLILIAVQSAQVLDLKLLLLALLLSLDQTIDLRLSQVVEPTASQTLQRCESFRWIQRQCSLKELQGVGRKLARIPSLQRFGLLNVWELKPDKPGVFVEFLLLVWRKFAQNLLDTKELVNLRFSRKQGFTVGDFAHNATSSPDIDLLAVVG